MAPWISWISAAEGCRNEGNPTKAAKSSISQCSLLFRKPFPWPLGFSGFPPPRVAEMRGTPQKQQNRPFRNVRSFSGSHFQGPMDFLDFRPPRSRNEGNTTKAAKSSISQCSLLFRKPFPWPLTYSGFSAAEARKSTAEAVELGETHKISHFSLVVAMFLLDFVREKPPQAQNPSGKTTKKLRIRQLSRGLCL